MAFLGKLRSQRHYAAGTLRLQCLGQGASSSPAEDLDFAVKHLRKAVKLNPGFVDAHHNLGNALIMGTEYNLATSPTPSAADTPPACPRCPGSDGVRKSRCQSL